jgi:hypothetical protein
MQEKEKITVRFSQNTLLQLSEIKDSLNVSYSLLIRTIVSDFLIKNEERLYQLIDNKKNNKKYKSK